MRYESEEQNDEFQPSIQNIREHSSEPYMVNGVDILQLPNPNKHGPYVSHYSLNHVSKS